MSVNIEKEFKPDAIDLNELQIKQLNSIIPHLATENVFIRI